MRIFIHVHCNPFRDEHAPDCKRALFKLQRRQKLCTDKNVSVKKNISHLTGSASRLKSF